MRPHSFILGNICFEFLGHYICRAASSIENIGSCITEKENNTCLPAIQLFVKCKIQETLVRYLRNLVYDNPHFTENAKQIFAEMKLCGLISNFYCTFLYLWAIYIFPRSVRLFFFAVLRLQTNSGNTYIIAHSSNWERDHAVSFWGIFDKIFGTVHFQCSL